MKKQIFKGMLFATASLFLLASCTKEDDNNSSGTPSSGSYMRAKVDGEQFSSSAAGQEMVTAVKEGGIINIAGSNGLKQEAISINLDGITQPGTYSLNSDSESTLDYANDKGFFGTSDCTGATGKIIVTAINEDKVEGTFEFMGKNGDDCEANGKTVTSGSFRAVFQK